MINTLGFKKMVDEEYFASEGLSNSFLIQFDRSPAHALTGIEKTKSMELGTMVHAFLFNKENFFDLYVVLPEDIKKDKRLKIFNDFMDRSENKNKEAMKLSELDDLEKITDNIFSYYMEGETTIKDIFDKSESEIAFFWEEEINGKKILRKGKADTLYRGPDFNIVLDIKKTENCLTFWRSVRDYKYYRQAATYIDGITIITGKPTYFYLIPFEMDAPYGVKVYKLDDTLIQQGRAENTRSIINWIEWNDRGQPLELYPNGIDTIYSL